jgi:hypothetical protein
MMMVRGIQADKVRAVLNFSTIDRKPLEPSEAACHSRGWVGMGL